MKIEEKIVRLLTVKNKTISVAESCTGGLLAQRLTSAPGASTVFGFGVVSYSARAKKAFLKVKPSLIRRYGEVSKEVALAMAKGIQEVSQSDYSISITGIAGPTGGTSQKPVGTVYLSLLSQKAAHIKKCLLRGNRNQIRMKATTIALHWLHQVLKGGKYDSNHNTFR